MSVARKNLGPRLLAGTLKPRPGMYGAQARRPEGYVPGPMALPEAVERVALLVEGGMEFSAAFRQVLRELDPPREPDL